MSTILIVDDQPELRALFSRVLQNQGHRIVAAEDGLDALRKTEDFTPDLVLLDQNMPQMDGLSFLKKVRRRPGWEKVPVILLSGLRTEETLRLGRELGVRDQLLKGSFTTRELRATVARHLGSIAAVSRSSAA